MIVTDESRDAEPAAAIGATGATDGGGASGADWQAASARVARASTFSRIGFPWLFGIHLEAILAISSFCARPSERLTASKRIAVSAAPRVAPLSLWPGIGADYQILASARFGIFPAPRTMPVSEKRGTTDPRPVLPSCRIRRVFRTRHDPKESHRGRGRQAGHDFEIVLGTRPRRPVGEPTAAGWPCLRQGSTTRLRSRTACDLNCQQALVAPAPARSGTLRFGFWFLLRQGLLDSGKALYATKAGL